MSKKQWKNVTDNVSLQFSTKSWANEEPDGPALDLSEIRSVLPTKTSATRAISDLESIGANGPFALAFANIPYEASETDLMNFFRLHDIIRVQKSEVNKGQGILEFRDKTGLVGALHMNEKVFINRPIRLKIATKDEMARLSMPGGRGRPQNQQSRNTQQSGLNLEDSDNWRAKKSTPTHSSGTGSASENVVGNERNRDTQKTWRQDRQPVVAASSGVSIDQSDNWRRGTRTGDSAPASQSSAGNRNGRPGGNFNRPANHFSEQTPPQKELVTRDSGDKKVSIFGEAKPVDTSSKDREIEKKLEETKKQVTDQPDTNVSKSGARSVKKPTSNASAPATSSNTSQSTPENKSSPSSSSGLEWRTTRPPATSSNRSRQVSDTSSVKSSDQSSAPAPQPEQQQQQIKVDAKLAPIPPNFWAERMKSKSTTPAPVASKDTVTILDRNSNTAKPQQQSLDTTTAAATATTSATVTTTAVTSPSEKTVASKPPVVISANGPFIDPRARSHHHSSGSSPAAAAPVSMTMSSLDNNNNTASVVSATVGSSINRAPVAAASSATASATANDPTKQGATPPARSGDLKGPWSKGPPRGLIDKA